MHPGEEDLLALKLGGLPGQELAGEGIDVLAFLALVVGVGAAVLLT